MLNKDSILPTKGKGSKISPKMLRFVEEYFVDLNGTKAILRAGYKTKNATLMATQLMNHPHVITEMKKLKDARSQKMEIKAEYLIHKLVSIIEETEQSNPQAALRAIELAGKSIALWKERQEISGPDGQSIEIQQRVKEDVADLESKLAGIAKRTGADVIAFVPKPRSQGSS